ncbi:NUDIX domain-containing protein, partial [bacterium]|nr:NUDIX domain-containing protein [bacterium]
MNSDSNTPSLICDERLLSLISSNLKNFEIKKSQGQETSRAAVAVTVVEVANDPGIYGIEGNENKSDHAALILTRRATSLKNHSGQWAFPGGRIDKNETPEEAALRELEEEVGLKLGNERVIGRLDDYVTHSGFVITPVVIWGGTGLEMTLE